jgi:Spy/CpxP family protein refolding chaperone
MPITVELEGVSAVRHRENRMYKLLALVLTSFVATTSHAVTPGPSPYVGQEGRPIKALAPDEVDGLLAGRGMGYAKSAELNGYPGPAHVLELADQLHLSDAQRAATSAIFTQMQRRAAAAGAQLVEQERQLDQRFADGSITKEALAASLARIGELQADVRRAHLDAHLAQVGVLTPEQRTAYVRLRGYADSRPADSGHHMKH